MDNTAVALISSASGVFGALLGVIITQCVETGRHKKEMIGNAMPVLINYTPKNTVASEALTEYDFKADDDDLSIETALLKNVGNGILFFDYIETKKHRYYPEQAATVDKNTVFQINLYLSAGESFEKCVLYGRDIYGNKYSYNAHFNFTTSRKHTITIDNSLPKAVK